jgi:hypothetical protein
MRPSEEEIGKVPQFNGMKIGKNGPIQRTKLNNIDSHEVTGMIR